MSDEIELKLAPGKLSLTQLARHPLLASAAVRRLRVQDTYYDTLDLTLKQRRVAIRARQQGQLALRTVKASVSEQGALSQRREWERPGREGAWDFGDIDHAATRHLLENCCAQLQPVFHTDFQRHAWRVSYGDAVIEVAYDRGHIASGARRQNLKEIEFELLKGQPDDLFACALELQQAFSLRPISGNKAETGYRLYLNAGPMPCRLPAPALSPEQSPLAAFRAIALTCLEQLLRNQEHIHIATPEFLHQARVALRRLRSALKLFSPVLPQGFSKKWNAVWRETGRQLGEARDWDVLRTQLAPELERRFPGDAGIARLQRRAIRQTQAAYRSAAVYFTSPDHARHLLQFTRALLDLREQHARTLATFLQKRINKLQLGAYTLAKGVHQMDDEGRHSLRIVFKKLRYALESTPPPESGKRNKPYLSSLSRLQEELGLINDCANAQVLLASLPHADRSMLTEGWLAGQHAILCERLPLALQDWMHQEKKRID